MRTLGQRRDLDVIGQQAQWQADGISVAEVTKLCIAYGLKPTVVNESHKRLAALQSPTILILNNNHCVVFEEVDSEGQVILFDPARGRIVQLHERELTSSWNGTAILFSAPPPSLLLQAALSLSVCIATLHCGSFLVRHIGKGG